MDIAVTIILLCILSYVTGIVSMLLAIQGNGLAIIILAITSNIAIYRTAVKIEEKLGKK